MKWPNGKAFAFTVFDDTDRGTLKNLSPVYALLKDLCFRTTKTVWPVSGPGDALIPGETCEDADYLEWVLQLQRDGFEIGWHNATYHTSLRNDTAGGLETFRSHFGHSPYTAANHASNEEAIYWGRARLSGAQALIYEVMRGFRGTRRFKGHEQGHDYFWGDLCRDKIRYVRNFVFEDINTLAQCPFMPYHDPDKPYVRQWFASSEGATVDSFCDMIESENQDRLEQEGGACIMYTHFGKGFSVGDEPHPRFARLMTELSNRNGWFPTTFELLNYLVEQGNGGDILPSERGAMERRWLLDSIRRRV